MTKTPIGALLFFLGVGALLVVASESKELADWAITSLVIALLLVLFAFVGKEPISDWNSIIGRFTGQ